MFTKNILKLQGLMNLPYFTVENAADALGIKIESARVFCSRYNKQGLFVKLKNNFYTASQKLEDISNKELFEIANILQVPSYVSFMTALVYYEISTQVQQNFVESASQKRSVEYEIKGINFRYYKIKKKYYFDFVKSNGLFMATKEKAFLDAVYLFSFGKYKLDFSSLDLEKLDKTRLAQLLKIYPEKTKKIAGKLCRI